MNNPLYDAALGDAVVSAYEDGEKVGATLRRLAITLDAYNFILEQRGVLPARVRRADRLAGNKIQMSHLYDVIAGMGKRIEQLEKALREAGVPLPEEGDITG